ncbi:hypothetical protein SAMN02910301_0350 [Lachnospiraceae bacterium XBD2001]|nr:hypothetical protein SAMN02910301_0350 [Lachnospiraceae bacterium XBD2001]
MMRMYFETMQNLLGQQYPVAIVLSLFAVETWLIMRNRRRSDDRFALCVAIVCAVVSPLYFMYLRVLHVPRGTMAVAFQILPCVALAAFGLTVLGQYLASKYGKRVWLLLAIGVIVLASQPWTFTKSRIIFSNPGTAKVDAEVYELADMMDEGTAFMPSKMATQFCEVQSQTNVCFDDDFFVVKMQTPTDMVNAIFTYQSDYLVCPKEACDAEWFGIYGYQEIGETEHYIVFGHRLTEE